MPQLECTFHSSGDGYRGAGVFGVSLRCFHGSNNPMTLDSRSHLYLGTFLIALTTLVLQITLARLLSVITWYHLAFFAISVAMLGMTAGAVVVYLKSGWFEREKLDRSLSLACLGYAFAAPAALLILCSTPLGFEGGGVTSMTVAAFVIVTAASFVPFCLSGIAISAVLTRAGLPVGRIYGVDLVGAAMGCLLVLGGLELIDAPSLVLLSGAFAALAALSFARRTGTARLKLICVSTFVMLAIAVPVNSSSTNGIRPLAVKGRIQNPESILLERWNSYSRVVVDQMHVGPPQYWGASPKAPRHPIPQLWMRIDGDAGTTVRQFSSADDIDHLRFDVTNVAYFLRPPGQACVIGVGGGRDIQSALTFGHQVTGIDVNRIFIDLLQTYFKDFASLANNERVTLVVDEARSYLARSELRCNVLQMSLIDTWAATGAGAFSFTENGLYTVEAWRLFLDRLADDGLFTVSRWHNPDNLGETGRVISLAVATLLESGVAAPAEHLAMVSAGNVSTLIVSRAPLSPVDVGTTKSVVSELEYELVFAPGTLPENAIQRGLLSAESLQDLQAIIADEPLNYLPPSDDSPYFFNMLKLSNLAAASLSGSGIVRGNITATITLLILIACLAVFCILTVVVPLLAGGRPEQRAGERGSTFWWGAVYFTLIGAGFMLVEIGLIQRLSVFLGHPVYALGVLLFTIILSAGLGSMLSEFVSLSRTKTINALPIAAAFAVLAAETGISALVSGFITAPMSTKIALSIAAVFPLGLLLGFFFPLGLRMAQSAHRSETPWFWSLNGIFGVLSSAVAVLVSIYLSIAANFYLGALCYLSLLICNRPMASGGSVSRRP